VVVVVVVVMVLFVMVLVVVILLFVVVLVMVVVAAVVVLAEIIHTFIQDIYNHIPAKNMSAGYIVLHPICSYSSCYMYVTSFVECFVLLHQYLPKYCEVHNVAVFSVVSLFHAFLVCCSCIFCVWICP
jgi:hypothetical protein